MKVSYRIGWLHLVLIVLSSGRGFTQDNLFKEKMFSDLEVTNSVTKSYRDSVYVFHVKVLDEYDKAESTKRYYWFYQGEVKCTVGNYTGKLLHGYFEKFDRKENLIEKGMFSYGLKDGDWLTWYSNGNVARRLHWNSGLRSGDFTEHALSGTIVCSGTYRRDKLHGYVMYYTQDGVLDRKVKYKNGVLVKTKEKRGKKDKNPGDVKKDNSAELQKLSPVGGPKEKRGLFRRKKKEKSNTPALQSYQIAPVKQNESPKKERRKRKENTIVPPATDSTDLKSAGKRN